MNKLILLFLPFFAFNANSQTLEVVVSENFDNNKSGWHTDGQIYKVADGIIKCQTANTKNFFNFASSKQGIKSDRSSYIVKAKLKIESLAEGGRSGLALSNVLHQTSGEMISGYLFYIELYEGKYFLTCHNVDDKTPKKFIGFDVFPLGEFIELKISIDNSEGSCEVFINNDLAYDLEGPLFNINQVGLYTKGSVSSEYSSLIIEQSVNKNKDFAYDLIDSQYDDQLEVSRLYRGRHDFGLLLGYVPKILLSDDLYYIVAKQLDFTIDDLISELLNDLDCKIEKSDYTEASTPKLKYYKLKYKSVSMVISYNKDSKIVVSTSLFFKTSYDAESFFNKYVALKKFTSTRAENNTKYASHPLMLVSFVSLSNSQIQFLY
jgi:hypothetical protein